jgi:hypothetical protein
MQRVSPQLHGRQYFRLSWRHSHQRGCIWLAFALGRFRMSTQMLLIVIAALVVALVLERNRSARMGRKDTHSA